jgi:hypothetical protein
VITGSLESVIEPRRKQRLLIIRPIDGEIMDKNYAKKAFTLQFSLCGTLGSGKREIYWFELHAKQQAEQRQCLHWR